MVIENMARSRGVFRWNEECVTVHVAVIYIIVSMINID